MKKSLYTLLITSLLSTPVFAEKNSIPLYNQPSFVRATYDYLTMPHGMQKMGLLGVNYFADITPSIYGGMGMYGSTVGTQGGLFVLALGGGLHHELFSHIWGDAGFDVGGGGGRSSLVGGGLMIRPHAGLQYDFGLARLGVHYSYISFPTGDIRSSQIGANLDIPFDFYYLQSSEHPCPLFQLKNLRLPCGKFLSFDRNDFGFLFQAYYQRQGTKNTENQIQDGTMGLIGAELDHYFTPAAFWWLKGSGAFTGVPNGYMDVLAGLGYHWQLGTTPLALVPQVGVGAGGGGRVDTGGGVLLQPLLGLEIPLSKSISARASGGYLWAPKGELSAYTLTGTLLYHLDVGRVTSCQPCEFAKYFSIENWRINIFNQTYLHPQRTFTSTTSSINLLALQIDQLFTPWFFMGYQGSFAYSGFHAGGYATGMIGPGLQTPIFLDKKVQLFVEGLVGAGGGGSLQLGGGAIAEPVAGVHVNLTDTLGLQASAGWLKALNSGLSTPVVNAGITIRFGTVEKASLN